MKDSNSDWGKAVDLIESWGPVLAAGIGDQFRALETIRNQSVHFNPSLYQQIKEKACDAIILLFEIITNQFSTDSKRWYFHAGGHFVRSDVLSEPFVKKFILPCCKLVGPQHKLEYDNGKWIVSFDGETSETDQISDEEFKDRYESYIKAEASKA
jgi:hypothetical protein